jgi:hypothetical protein
LAGESGRRGYERKLTEFAFLFILPQDWSAVTRRFWLIRSLRAGSQSATRK